MPKELEVIKYPNEILRNKSEDLDLKLLKDPKFKKWLADFELTMINKDGAGLAAPQVGKNIKIFVIAESPKNLFIINPKINKESRAKKTETEGCLSVIDKQGELFFAPVSRSKKISLSYYNEQGKLKKITADKFLARVIQHENDHLDGILFIDKISEEEMKKFETIKKVYPKKKIK